MSFQKNQALHEAIFTDMQTRPTHKMSFGMIAYWALTLLETHSNSIEEFDDIEEEWRNAVILHTPSLSALHDENVKRTPSLLRQFYDTVDEITESPRRTLKYLTLAALDSYAADPAPHMEATGLSRDQLDSVQQRLQECLPHLPSPSLLTTLRDFSKNSSVCSNHFHAAETVKALCLEAQYKYGLRAGF